MTQSLGSFGTNCDGCPFALCEHGDQYGCYVFDINADEKEAVRTNHGTFFKLTRRLCQFKRNKRWAKSSKIELNYERARQEVRIKYVLAILGSNSTQIINTLKGALRQSVLPEHIICYFVNGDKVEIEKTEQFLKTCGCKWSTILSNGEGVEWRVDVLQQTKSHFVAFFPEGYEFESDIFGYLDGKINDEGFRFRYIHSDIYGIDIFSRQAYYMNDKPLGQILQLIRDNERGYVDYDSFSDAARSYIPRNSECVAGA